MPYLLDQSEISFHLVQVTFPRAFHWLLASALWLVHVSNVDVGCFLIISGFRCAITITREISCHGCLIFFQFRQFSSSLCTSTALHKEFSRKVMLALTVLLIRGHQLLIPGPLLLWDEKGGKEESLESRLRSRTDDINNSVANSLIKKILKEVKYRILP